MNIVEFRELANSSEYDFLRDDKRLGDNIIFLTLGGSYAYGMNNENSDVDFRGIALNSKEEILLCEDFEQVLGGEDAVIYSFSKIIELLSKSNPNTVEMLGCRPEHYIILNEIGKELLKTEKCFFRKSVSILLGIMQILSSDV